MKQTIIITVLLAAMLVGTYFAGKTVGDQEGRQLAAAIYDKHIQEYKDALQRQTETLNTALSVQAVDLTKEVSLLLTDTKQIRAALKNQPQPLVLVKEGECKASEALLDARRKMIERVNK